MVEYVVREGKIGEHEPIPEYAQEIVDHGVGLYDTWINLAYEEPPEDFPDGGMGTAAEEAMLADETPPEMEDSGMSAGYPPMRDD